MRNPDAANGPDETARLLSAETGLIFNPIRHFRPNSYPLDPKVATYWCADCGQFSDDETKPLRCWDGDSCPLCGGIRCEYVGQTWGPR